MSEFGRKIVPPGTISYFRVHFSHSAEVVLSSKIVLPRRAAISPYDHSMEEDILQTILRILEAEVVPPLFEIKTMLAVHAETSKARF